jgi:hypothetical protein
MDDGNALHFCYRRQLPLGPAAMEKFFMEIVIALVALSCVPPDWEKHERATWMQVYAMAFGLVAIVIFIATRPWVS